MEINGDSLLEQCLLELYDLNLYQEDIKYCPSSTFTLKKNKCYLITGHDEEINLSLLKIMGGIYSPPRQRNNWSTQVFFCGIDLYNGKEQDIKKVRKDIAYVFRDGTMISNLNIQENLLLPFNYHYPGNDSTDALEKIKKDFQFFGIPDILGMRPDLISYCTKKELSFIRASLLEPQLILVEKPMFNLDEEEREQVVIYLENLKKRGVTIVIASRSEVVLGALVDEAIILERGNQPLFINRNQPEFDRLTRYSFLR